MRYRTTAADAARLPALAAKLRQAGLPNDFVESVIRLATRDQGICDLVSLWDEFRNSEFASESDACITDLERLIEEFAEKEPRPWFQLSLPGI